MGGWDDEKAVSSDEEEDFEEDGVVGQRATRPVPIWKEDSARPFDATRRVFWGALQSSPSQSST